MEGRVWYSLYDKIFQKENLEKAFQLVKKNKGAPGVDKVTVEQYERKREENLNQLQEKLKEKSYCPKPVRRKMIQKEDGKKRPLGIPTVEDRIVQAAIRNIIEPIFEEDFLPCSYGFRPKRSPHMALDQVSQYLKEGYTYVINVDLQSYFDTIPHEKVEKCIRKRMVDGSVLSLIRQFLKAGVMQEEGFVESVRGAPQGGVLSPLLSNVYLHQLDQLMEKRGHRMVRFADDFVIFHRSAKGSERVMKGVTRFLEEELGLKVNTDKSSIVDVYKEPLTFLGYEFYRADTRRIDPKKIQKFKQRVKEMTRRNQTVNLETLIEEKLNPYLRGWANYFKYGQVKTLFDTWDAWIRRRLRMIQLRSWRKVKSLHRELRKKGWSEDKLRGIRMTAWRSSKSRMVHAALDMDFFRQRNLVFLSDQIQ